MKTGINKIIKLLLIFLLIIGIGYASYRLYNYIVQDITVRVKKGVSEGIGEGIGETVNPLKWPGKLFGGKKA